MLKKMNFFLCWFCSAMEQTTLLKSELLISISQYYLRREWCLKLEEKSLGDFWESSESEIQ